MSKFKDIFKDFTFWHYTNILFYPYIIGSLIIALLIILWMKISFPIRDWYWYKFTLPTKDIQFHKQLAENMDKMLNEKNWTIIKEKHPYRYKAYLYSKIQVDKVKIGILQESVEYLKKLKENEQI
jgi:hypothetical protein